ELAQTLDAGTPRIQLAGATGTRPKMMKSSFTIMPYMMMPGDDKVVADAICAAMTHSPAFTTPVSPSGSTASIGGIWDVTVTYLRGTGHQRFLLEQQNESVSGVHQGAIYHGNLKGEIAANQVSLHSALPVGGNEIHYAFAGVVDGDTMSGDATLGEYGKAKW